MQGVWAVPEQGRYESAIHRGAALTEHRRIGHVEAKITGSAALLLLLMTLGFRGLYAEASL